MRAPARRVRAAVRRAARGVVVVQLTALRGVQQLDVRGGESGGQCALAGTESEGEPAGSDERHEAERNERAQQQRRQQQRCESPAAPSEVGKPRTHGGRVYRLAEPLIWVKHPSFDIDRSRFSRIRVPVRRRGWCRIARGRPGLASAPGVIHDLRLQVVHPVSYRCLPSHKTVSL